MKRKISWSAIAIIAFLFTITYVMVNMKKWNKEDGVIEQDITYYYSYLPSAFIHHDMTLEFMNEDFKKHSKNYWFLETEEGNRVNKMSMGMAIMYSPFFFIGHGVACSTDYERDGFSAPYKMMIQLGVLVYLALGLIFLRKLLLRYVTDSVTAFTILIVTFGTNLLFFSTIRSPMSHAYLFSLICVFLWILDRWLEKGNIALSFNLGIVLGLITLIRPTNIIIVILFLLWRTDSFSVIFYRLKELFQKPQYVIIIAVSAFIIWLPQLLYWKTITGQYFYFSYQDEGFFFSDPKILKGFFSFRKGWLIYTPVMIFSLLGFIIMYKKNKSLFTPVLVVFLLHIYIIFSWWCWWYGGSFGQRPMIDIYGLLALPLAFFIKVLFEQKKWIRSVGITIISLLITLNLFQTYQFKGGKTIHWDAMTAKAYFAVFGKLKTPENYEEMLDHPDYEAAKRGDR